MAITRPLIYLSLLFCIFYNVSCADGDDDDQKNMKEINLLLKDIDGKKNENLSVDEKDPLTDTSMVTAKKNFTMAYNIYYYSVDDPDDDTDNSKLINSYKICDLLDDKKDKSDIAEFPAEMIRVIFTDQNTCDFQAGSKDITVSAVLPYVPDHQTNFTLPDKDRFYLMANVVAGKGKGDPKNNYIFSTLWQVAITDPKESKKTNEKE